MCLSSAIDTTNGTKWLPAKRHLVFARLSRNVVPAKIADGQRKGKLFEVKYNSGFLDPVSIKKQSCKIYGLSFERHGILCNLNWIPMPVRHIYSEKAPLTKWMNILNQWKKWQHSWNRNIVKACACHMRPDSQMSCSHSTWIKGKRIVIRGNVSFPFVTLVTKLPRDSCITANLKKIFSYIAQFKWNSKQVSFNMLNISRPSPALRVSVYYARLIP